MVAQLADISITLLCVSGLALLGWWFFGKLLCPTPRGVRAHIYGQGAGDNLEQSVRALVWLRGMGLLSCPIVIVTQDLNPAGLDVARRLASRWPNIALQTDKLE